MPLEFEIRLYVNPWPDTVPALMDILTTATTRRAKEIAERVENGSYPSSSMAFVVLDPTAPISRPSEEAILAVICVGDEGPRFAPNAMAKAAEHRDHGTECGALALSQKHRLADGDFRYGFSADVSGTIIGASGQNSLQDQFEATMLGAEINYEVASARDSWEEEHSQNFWFSAMDEGRFVYRGIWERSTTAVEHGTSY